VKNPAKKIGFQTSLRGGLGQDNTEKKAINLLSAIHLFICGFFGDRKVLNLKGQIMHLFGELLALAIKPIHR
jgi:hypothetical protein